MAEVLIGVSHHRSNWGEQGTVEADVEIIAFGELNEDIGWAHDVTSDIWFGPGPVGSVIAMLAADLLMPGLGRVFSGGLAHRG